MELNVVCAIASFFGATLGGLFIYLSGRDNKEKQKMRNRIIQLSNELLQVYRDVAQLNEIKREFIQTEEMSKTEVNQIYPTSKKIYPSKVKERIKDLEASLH